MMSEKNQKENVHNGSDDSIYVENLTKKNKKIKF